MPRAGDAIVLASGERVTLETVFTRVGPGSRWSVAYAPANGGRLKLVQVEFDEYRAAWSEKVLERQGTLALAGFRA